MRTIVKLAMSIDPPYIGSLMYRLPNLKGQREHGVGPHQVVKSTSRQWYVFFYLIMGLRLDYGD